MVGSGRHGTRRSSSSKSIPKSSSKSKNKQGRSEWEKSEQFQRESEHRRKPSGKSNPLDDQRTIYAENRNANFSNLILMHGMVLGQNIINLMESFPSPRQDASTSEYQTAPVGYPYPSIPPISSTASKSYSNADPELSSYDLDVPSRRPNVSYGDFSFSLGTPPRQSNTISMQEASTSEYQTAPVEYPYPSIPPIPSTTSESYSNADPELSFYDFAVPSWQPNSSYEKIHPSLSTQLQQSNFVPNAPPPRLSTAFEFSQFTPSPTPQQRSTQFYTQPWDRSNLIEESTSRFTELRVEDSFSEMQDDPEYVIIAKPEGYFKLGRIFSTFEAEPERMSNEVQTFVVMSRYKHISSACCLLQHYSKINDRSGQNRALIFAVGSSPKLFPGEEPPNMVKFPIMIEKPSVTIDPALRLDLSRVYTVYHNIRVRTVGRIDRNCLKALESTFLKAVEANMSEDENSKVGQGSDYFKTDYTTVDNFKLPTANLRQLSQSPPPVVPTKTGYNKVNLKNRTISSTSPSTSEPLHAEFKIRVSKHFRRGRVIKVLWSEPLGSSTWSADDIDDIDLINEVDEERLPSRYGEKAYHSIRRFVIARESKGHSLCVPILTYGMRGTNKPGVKPEYHAIIYSTNKAPQPMPGETGLIKKPIRMVPTTNRDQLHPSSRLVYNKVYTIEHNIKVCFIGELDQHSLGNFSTDFMETFERGE